MNLTDIELINKIKDSNCEESLKTLFNRHIGIFKELINKYEKSLIQAGIYVEDIKNDGLYIAFNAAKKYDETKSKFSTYFYNTVRYHCLTLLNKHKQHFTQIDNVEILDEGSEGLILLNFDIEELRAIYNECFKILNSLEDKRIKEVWEKRLENQTWQTISGNMSPPVHHQTAINLFERGLQEIKRIKIHEKYIDFSCAV